MTVRLREWYRAKRVFVTGHTGFKGSWLAAWLRDAGATVTGYALPPTDTPNLFEAARIADGITSIVGDIRESRAMEAALRSASPEIVFHLAAQSLVRRSYREPVETYDTNVMGTVRLLDAARRLPTLRAVVVVTSDKCYENQGLDRGYAENDPMGGHDPYSSSKGCAELVTSALRRSFFGGSTAAVASARAGNVIGGGDWAEDRLIPDIARAAAAGQPVLVRNPEAVRPWQFVLEPLRGYLMLGRALVDCGDAYAEAWNFGPHDADAVAVRELVQRIRDRWNRVAVQFPTEPSGPHEASYLTLDCAKARSRLAWEPVLNLNDAVEMTFEWYRAFHADPSSAPTLIQRQLATYARRVADVEAAA